jgi:hypothetical protein
MRGLLSDSRHIRDRTQPAWEPVFARIHASNVCCCAPVTGNELLGSHILQTIADLTNYCKNITETLYKRNMESGLV